VSAPKALRATSLRDSLAKTVKLLTKQGIDVQFRGHQPFVQTKGNKAVRLVLPEINDNAPPELLEALQGFLDHEVGHIFYTPFARGEKFAAGNRTRHSLCNIIEDIRLEKLLPRDLPGTKDNLERMYESVMPTFFGPTALKANDPKTDKNEAFSCVMVCAMRALAGQKAFQKFMDDNKLWPHFMPLISKMPNISRRLRDLETFEDVERMVTDILDAIKPPPPPEEKDEEDPKQKPEKGKSDKKDKSEPEPDGSDDKDDGASDDSQDGEDDADGGGLDQDPDESKDDGQKGKPDKDQDSDDGEGHGDGEGTDDGNPDDEEEGQSKGDGEEEGDDDGAGDSDRDEGDQDEQGSAGEGKQNRTLRDALAALEPTHRRALFLYKKKRQTVAEIASDLEVSEDQTRDMLAQARRQVRDFLNGG
jgi:hypothetical protein